MFSQGEVFWEVEEAGGIPGTRGGEGGNGKGGRGGNGKVGGGGGKKKSGFTSF